MPFCFNGMLVDIHSADSNTALACGKAAGDNIHSSWLSRAVLTEKSVNFSLLDTETDVADSDFIAVFFGEIFYLYQSMHLRECWLEYKWYICYVESNCKNIICPYYIFYHIWIFFLFIFCDIYCIFCLLKRFFWFLGKYDSWFFTTYKITNKIKKNKNVFHKVVWRFLWDFNKNADIFIKTTKVIKKLFKKLKITKSLLQNNEKCCIINYTEKYLNSNVERSGGID